MPGFTDGTMNRVVGFIQFGVSNGRRSVSGDNMFQIFLHLAGGRWQLAFSGWFLVVGSWQLVKFFMFTESAKSQKHFPIYSKSRTPSCDYSAFLHPYH